MKTVEAAKLFENGSLDFVFVDAGHDYESVAEDIHYWLPKVKSGGMIAGHDYPDFKGVVKAVDTLLPHRELVDHNCWRAWV